MSVTPRNWLLKALTFALNDCHLFKLTYPLKILEIN